jgi:hypothetical protein
MSLKAAAYSKHRIGQSHVFEIRLSVRATRSALGRISEDAANCAALSSIVRLRHNICKMVHAHTVHDAATHPQDRIIFLTLEGPLVRSCRLN